MLSDPVQRTRGGGAQEPRRQAPARGVIVTYSPGTPGTPEGHNASTRTEIARRLAGFTGFTFEGEYDAQRSYASPPYFVPGTTLTSATAVALGIRDERDLFGAVVPCPVVATKTITHPLVASGSQAPPGWCTEFPHHVRNVVLEGFSVFTYDDALQAGRQLLARGTVRVKLATGIAGHGQFTASSETELVRALDAIDVDELSRTGAVVEQNLTDVTTYSVGRVRVADTTIAYYGTQSLTTNHRGMEVYGGSAITAVLGDFDTLVALNLAEDLLRAIAQARVYDHAATQCLAGFFASRRNYDVAQGFDAAGRRRSGVLEQSWRIGGATGAEIAALEAFRTNPSLSSVRANSCEVYGDPPVLPPNATVYFSGIDPHVGSLTKYAWTETP